MYYYTIRSVAAHVILLVSLCGISASAQDAVKVDPEHFKLLFENADVRVIDVRVDAGGKVPLHSHPSGFAYALSNFKAKTMFLDGTSVVGEYKAGESAPTKPVTHSEENTGDTPAHLLLIEFKPR